MSPKGICKECDHEFETDRLYPYCPKCGSEAEVEESDESQRHGVHGGRFRGYLGYGDDDG